MQRAAFYSKDTKNKPIYRIADSNKIGICYLSQNSWILQLLLRFLYYFINNKFKIVSRVKCEETILKQDYEKEASNISDMYFPNRVSSSDFQKEIFWRTERNGHIRLNSSFHLDYHIVRVSTRSMKGFESEEEIEIGPLKSLPKASSEDENNEFNQPQTYKLAMQLDISDPCQNCHYIPAPQKIWVVRLQVVRQVKLCLGCLLLLTKVSISKNQGEKPFNNSKDPCSDMRRNHKQKTKKRRSPNSKFIKFPPDQIHSVTAFNLVQHWNIMKYEEYGQDCSWSEDYRRQWSRQHQTSYLQNLRTIPSMIIILLVSLYRQIFKD